MCFKVLAGIVQEHEEGVCNFLDLLSKLTEALNEHLDAEQLTALTMLLYYLMHEVLRPEEVTVTIDSVSAVWAPLLIRPDKSDPEQTKDARNLIALLLKHLRKILPTAPSYCAIPSERVVQECREQNKAVIFSQLREDPLGLSLYW